MNKIVQYYLKYKNNICKLEQGGVKLSSLRCAFDGVFDYLVFGSTITISDSSMRLMIIARYFAFQINTICIKVFKSL